MSQTVNNRSENKLDVFIKARNLSNYTIKICSNEKVFLPQYRKSFTVLLEKTAIKIFINSWSANNIVVTSEETLQERLKLQVLAIRGCNDLLALIQLAKPLFHLTAKRVRYWGTQTIGIRKDLQSWNVNDKKRYKNFL